MKAIRVILACIRKADKEFNLINNGDRICLGISGGKDSIAMLYALNLYKKFSKTNFEIIPCTIDLGFPKYSYKKIESFSKKLGYDLHIEDGTTVYEILKTQKEIQKTPGLPCSICSKMKKAIINKVAHDFNCNKVAFAHHRDDAIETLLMNEIYGGRISTFSPKMFLSGEKITFIRPLVLAKEGDILRLCKEENLPISPSKCPNDKNTQREEMKKILNNIYEKYPSSRENFLNMLLNNSKQDIFYQHLENKIEGTNLFYKQVITTNDLLDYLFFLNKKPQKNNYKSTKYLLFSKDKIIASLEILNEKNDKKFNIIDYKYNKKEQFKLFLKEILLNIFENSNPCLITIKINKKNIKIFDELNFKKDSENIYKLILNDINKIR